MSSNKKNRTTGQNSVANKPTNKTNGSERIIKTDEYKRSKQAKEDIDKKLVSTKQEYEKTLKEWKDTEEKVNRLLEFFSGKKRRVKELEDSLKELEKSLAKSEQDLKYSERALQIAENEFYIEMERK